MKDPSDKNKLIIDEEAAQVVRDIFRMTLEGLSKRAICRFLKDHGVPNPTEYKRSKGFSYSNPNTAQNDGLWNPTTIIRLLKNEAYIGTMVQGKQRVVSYKIHDRVSQPEDKWIRVPNAMPVIISLEQFEKVQALLAKNTREVKQTHSLSLLAGFVRCFDCKKAMRRKTGGNVRVAYYVCRSHDEKRICSSHSIRISVLESAVFIAVKAQIAMVENLRGIIAHIHEQPVLNAQPSRLKAMIDSKRKEHDKLNTINDDLIMDWKKGIIDKATLDRLREKNERQIKQMAEAIAKMEDELKVCNDNSATHPVFEAFAKYANITELDREILAALVDVIYIHENKEITIVFRHDDSIQAIREFVEEHREPLKKLA